MKEAHLLSTKSEIFDAVEKHLPVVVFYQIHQLASGTFAFTYLSPRMFEIIEANLEEIMSKPELVYSKIQPEYHDIVLNLQASAFQNVTPFSTEFPITDKHGDIKWLYVSSVPAKQANGDIIWNGIQLDITTRKQEELHKQKANRELRLLNAINDVILKTDHENKLIEKSFDVLIEIGDYKLVWSCNLPDISDSNQVLEPIHAIGELNYLKNISIDLSNEQMNQGPTASVLLHGKTFINNKISQSTRFGPWVEQASKHGIRSSIVIPFNIDNRPGALNIYSSNEDAFDLHEVQILERVASNIIFGIAAIRKNNQLENKTKALTERVKELRCLYKVNSLLTDAERIDDSLYIQIAYEIAPAFLYPEHCHSRICIDHKRIEPTPFPLGFPILKKTIEVNNEKICIEVTYDKEMPKQFEGPFLKEEMELITAISTLIKQHLIKAETFNQLEQAQANLSTIFKSAGISYAILNTQYDVIMLNEEFVKSFELNTGNSLKKGDNFVELVRPERRRFVLNQLNRIKNGTNSQTNFYVESFNQNNNLHILSATYYPISLNHSLNAILMVGLDVTEQKKAEKERDFIIEELTARNNDLQQFTHIISHNLRAPVANIIGLTKILQDPELPTQEQSNIISKIESSTSRLDEVISDLNKIIQIRREINEIIEPVNFTEVIQEVVGSIDHQIKELKATVLINIQPEANILNTVKSYIISIFYNLISNSLKYTQEGIAPELTITIVKNKEIIKITYRDNGLGIDLVAQGNKVFGLYQRFHLHKEGKGLGLYITKTQIDLLGGTIELDSQVNQGVTFTIKLPVENQSTQNN